MSDPCIGCRHLRFCEEHNISFLDCDGIDFDDPEAIIVSDEEELSNTAPWNITEYRLVENIIDYGDSDDVIEEIYAD
jgi:hypothetical protein